MAAKKEEVKFVKQVTLRPRERSKRKRKSELVNHSELSKKKNKKINKNHVVFIKQVPIHPRDMLKKLAAKGEKVKFKKQFPVDIPVHRLRRKAHKKFKHPRNTMKIRKVKLAETILVN